MRSAGFSIIAIALAATFAAAQGPRPGGGPPPWARVVDVNANGKIEREEYREAAETFFTKSDRNGNRILEQSELPKRPGPDGPRPGGPEGPRRPVGIDGPRRPGGPDGPRADLEVPPSFLFLLRGASNLTKAEFDEQSTRRFNEIDTNSDGAIDMQEIRTVRPPDDRQGPPDNPAMAKFIGAEMRFGDKQVKGAPFSAETLREESKRLFDGSLVKNQTRGKIYRDGEGRIRQEMPLDSINGFPVLGRDNEPLTLIHIVDHIAGKAMSLNYSSKTFFDVPFLKDPPLTPKEEPQDAKVESLGKQTFDGVTVEGTRTTIEIPVGQIGNEKPVLVVTEKWFSPELQMIVMSKHTDPFIGEVIFRLVNIKLGEPGADLFKVPADFKQVEPRPRPDGKRPLGRRPE